ncbi:unnamed protein product [Eruca vesicaria subsp. sativa]|uniref:Uncharacterized protein n=1 Tax=Eruca vesicaria subsp. sativa TaxID=29727 RepID=A0ABC8K181_ERUVS|nr:unnamed protein product [Eruca vesicaria subsp. sativa]
MLPMIYNFQAPLLDVCWKEDSSVWTVSFYSGSYALKLMYPNYDGSTESTIHGSSGLGRRGATYMTTDDLTISPTNSCSTICILKKLNVGLDEIEEHVIIISKTEGLDGYTSDVTISLFQVKVLHVLGYRGTAEEPQHLKSLLAGTECIPKVRVEFPEDVVVDDATIIQTNREFFTLFGVVPDYIYYFE